MQTARHDCFSPQQHKCSRPRKPLYNSYSSQLLPVITTQYDSNVSRITKITPVEYLLWISTASLLYGLYYFTNLCTRDMAGLISCVVRDVCFAVCLGVCAPAIQRAPAAAGMSGMSRLDGHFCAVHVVAGMPISVSLTYSYRCLCYTRSTRPSYTTSRCCDRE